jgi:probable phosphoglycerate mutase
MIYFIRHGESESNVKRVFAGQKDDTPLTEKGMGQAKETAKHLKSLNIFVDRIVASPLKRTLKTAQIIADELGFDISKILIDKRVAEYDMGAMTGKLFQEMTSKVLVSGEGAEDPQAFLERVGDAIREFQKMPGNTLIASHAGVGRVLETVKENKPPEVFYDIPAYGNASVTVIDWIQ